MKNYKVVSVILPVLKNKELALEQVLTYLEEKLSEGFKVEQILVYTDKEIQLLCSETGSYHIEDDIFFNHLI